MRATHQFRPLRAAQAAKVANVASQVPLTSPETQFPVGRHIAGVAVVERGGKWHAEMLTRSGLDPHQRAVVALRQRRGLIDFLISGGASVNELWTKPGEGWVMWIFDDEGESKDFLDPAEPCGT